MQPFEKETSGQSDFHPGLIVESGERKRNNNTKSKVALESKLQTARVPFRMRLR